jgi:hypothetical protein
MKLNIYTSIGLLMLGSSPVAALGDSPKGTWTVARAQKTDPTTVLLAANGQDSVGVGEASSPNVWASADNAFAFANGSDDFNFFSSGRSSSAGRALIIPENSPDPKGIAEVEEDMGVMAHILNKAASGKEEKGNHAMGIIVHSATFGGFGAPRNLFLEGYGALFFLNVNFPLIAPADQKKESEAKEDTSSEWEEARRELHRPAGQGFGLTLPGVTTVTAPAEEYDADKVEDLKKDLIAALKNGAHIRKLKGDESVTVIVTGRSSSGVVKTLTRKPGSGSGSRSVTATTVHGGSSEPRATKLILRAKKTDLEAFQKDNLSLDEFRKKVSVMTY